MGKDIQDILATLPSVEEVARMPRNKFVEVYEEQLSFVQLLIGTQKEMQEQIYKLQRRLNTNSSNSGIPPSRNPIGYEESPNSQNASEAKDEKDIKDDGEGPTGTSAADCTKGQTSGILRQSRRFTYFNYAKRWDSTKLPLPRLKRKKRVGVNPTL